MAIITTMASNRIASIIKTTTRMEMPAIVAGMLAMLKITMTIKNQVKAIIMKSTDKDGVVVKIVEEEVVEVDLRQMARQLSSSTSQRLTRTRLLLKLQQLRRQKSILSFSPNSSKR